MADIKTAPGEPLVSVVIIFLNAERFLAEAIESVRAQTWRNWELLLVDDGSTDDSTGIAQRYAAAEPGRIAYVEHEAHRNRGMSSSRNLGAAHAAGEWIAFLDSDDVWTPEALATRLVALRDNPGAEIVYGPAMNWHSWDSSRPQHDQVQDVAFAPGVVPNGALLASHFIEHGTSTPCPGATVVRRPTFERLGGFEDSFRGMYEDQVFWFKAALGARVLIVPRTGLFYRQHDDSCCSVEFRTAGHLAARLRFLQWARRHAEQVGASDPHLTRTLRRHLRAARWSTGTAGRLRKSARRLVPRPVIGWLKAAFHS